MSVEHCLLHHCLPVICLDLDGGREGRRLAAATAVLEEEKPRTWEYFIPLLPLYLISVAGILTTPLLSFSHAMSSADILSPFLPLHTCLISFAPGGGVG